MTFTKSQMGNKGSGQIVDEADLTAEGGIISSSMLISELNKLVLALNYTAAEGTSISGFSVVPYGSFDAQTWYPIPVNVDKETPPNAAIDAGAYTITISDTGNFIVPCIDVSVFDYAKIVVLPAGSAVEGDVLDVFAYAEA